MAQVTLSITDLTEETDTNNLFPAEGKAYRFVMFSPLIVRQDGKINCLHKLVLQIPDTIDGQSTWQWNSRMGHDDLTKAGCGKCMGALYQKIGELITNGDLEEMVKNKNKKSTVDKNKLKDVLKATLS